MGLSDLFMKLLSLILKRELDSEVFQSQSAKKNYQKHLVVQNHFQKHYCGFYLLAKFQQQNKPNQFLMNLQNAEIPSHVKEMIDNFPKDVHPMTQLSTAVCAMNTESVFAKAYQEGVPKSEYWEYAFDDSMNCIA